MTLSSHIHAVILAGGAGTRFWPLSRKRKPKQVLKLFSENSLIQDTIARLDGLVPDSNLLIVTNAEQYKSIEPQLPQLTGKQYLLEPTPLNTAPCIGLAAIHILHKDPKGIMLVLPSDHLIRAKDQFQERVLQAVEVVKKHDPLVTMGIPPTRPETGYGYIQFDDDTKRLPEGVYRVKTFAEKPNLPTAQRFVDSGDFYWNSGMFIWRASRILAEIEEHLPEMHKVLMNIKQAIGTPEYEEVLRDQYPRIRPVSIDYGIMEVSRASIFVFKATFDWSDIGSWDEIYRITSEKDDGGSVIIGDAVSYDAVRNLIYSPNKLTAVLGVKDIMVINTPTATLICPRDRAQEVKFIVEKLAKEGRTRQL